MPDPLTVGRVSVRGLIADGGMGSVHVGRIHGAAGISRVCAVKRMHRHLLDEPHFVSMFLDEARVASRIQHPNVVALLDVVRHDDELLLVMELVRGVPLSKLLVDSGQAPLDLVTAVVTHALEGLHAAHEARDPSGALLELVHRDVSPQNILVGADGIARVMDFGIAKATVNLQKTREGELKGKLRYMAPEQLEGACTRRTDIFSMGVVLWEALAGRALFEGNNEAQLVMNLMHQPIPSLRELRPELPEAVDAIVQQALQREPDDRPASARAFARALLDATSPATTETVGAWVEAEAAEALRGIDRLVREVEAPDEKSDNTRDAIEAGIVATSNKTVGGLGRSVPPPTAEPSRRGTLALGLAAIALGGLVAVVARGEGGTSQRATSGWAATLPVPNAAPASSTIEATPSATAATSAVAPRMRRALPSPRSAPSTPSATASAAKPTPAPPQPPPPAQPASDIPDFL